MGEEKMPKDARNNLNQASSLVESAMDRCLASVEDRDTLVCFLLRQAIGNPPNVTK